MSEETVSVATAFLVIVDHDAQVTVSTGPFPGIEQDRPATLLDIETFGGQVVRDCGREMLARALRPAPEPTAGERVSKALKRRKS